MSGLAVALGFLTRLPVPAREVLAPGALAGAALWFPVVGVLVGGVLGATRLVAELALPAGAATALALIAAVLVTGALHEDGLADTADGFGAHVARERRLEIMRDPRVGTFGALALLLTTLLAWAVLADLDGEACLRAAVAGHVLARWAMLVHSATSPPARAGGTGTLLRVGPGRFAAATVLTAALVWAAVGVGVPAARAALEAVALLAAALLLVAGMGAATRRLIGGTTGDTHGAVGKLVEVAVYVVAAALLRA